MFLGSPGMSITLEPYPVVPKNSGSFLFLSVQLPLKKVLSASGVGLEKG